jgi:predicted cupin superfamily sugar epimerase
MKDASYWIERLELEEHPEGGYFRETHRSIETIRGEHLPERYGGDRRFSTAIYFLIMGGRPSRLHRLKSEEIWHFYTGSPVTVHIINAEGKRSRVRLGDHPEEGEVFQGIIHAGAWFGAVVDDPGSYALVGCTVAPGFDFRDFEIGDRASLLELYPQHRDLIDLLNGE